MTRPRRFHGWTVAATLWLALLFTTGLPFYGASVMIAAMAREMAMDKTTIGLGFSLLTVVWGLSGPLTAALLNRRGLRFTVTLGSLIIACGAAAIATLVQDVTSFVVIFGGVVGLGIGIASNLPAQTGVTLWFERRRPLVMSLVMTASGVGGFVGPTLLQHVSAAPGGWRTAWLAVSAGTLLCAAIAAMFLRDRPSDLGQWPDGIEPGREGAIHAVAAAARRWTTASALREPDFWRILLAAIVFSAPIPMLVAHGVIHFQGLGHAAADAARAIGLMVLMSVPGKVLGGLLCHRFAPQRVWAFMMLLITAGLATGVDATTSAGVLLFAGLIGLGYGACIICWASITAGFFGATSFATVMGLMVPVSMFVTSAVPTLAGLLHDRVGSYAAAFWGCSAAMLAGAMLIGSLPRSRAARQPSAPSAASANSSEVTRKDAAALPKL
jgi:cyanate permease